jgi:hypothetical protein
MMRDLSAPPRAMQSTKRLACGTPAACGAGGPPRPVPPGIPGQTGRNGHAGARCEGRERLSQRHCPRGPKYPASSALGGSTQQSHRPERRRQPPTGPWPSHAGGSQYQSRGHGTRAAARTKAVDMERPRQRARESSHGAETRRQRDHRPWTWNVSVSAVVQTLTPGFPTVWRSEGGWGEAARLRARPERFSRAGPSARGRSPSPPRPQHSAEGRP